MIIKKLQADKYYQKLLYYFFFYINFKLFQLVNKLQTDLKTTNSLLEYLIFAKILYLLKYILLTLFCYKFYFYQIICFIKLFFVLD